MCRKLETEEEKVLPFYASSLTAEEQEDVDAAVLEPPSEPLAAVSMFLVYNLFFCLMVCHFQKAPNIVKVIIFSDGKKVWNITYASYDQIFKLNFIFPGHVWVLWSGKFLEAI